MPVVEQANALFGLILMLVTIASNPLLFENDTSSVALARLVKVQLKPLVGVPCVNLTDPLPATPKLP